MLLVFVLARKRRLDLVTVRAVAERRPTERSGVDERRAAYRKVLDFSPTHKKATVGGKDIAAAAILSDLLYLRDLSNQIYCLV
jgi:hypothetical protein